MITFDDLKACKYFKYDYYKNDLKYIVEITYVEQDEIGIKEIWCSDGKENAVFEYDIDRNKFKNLITNKVFVNIEVFYSKDDIVEYLI